MTLRTTGHRALPTPSSGEKAERNEQRYRSEVARSFGVVDDVVGQVEQRLADIEVNGGAGGALVAVSSHSDTNQTEVDVPLTSGADVYRLVGWVEVLTDAQDVELVVTDDDFVSVETGASDYSHFDLRREHVAAATVGASGDDADDSIVLANSIGNATNERLWIDLKIQGAGDSGAFTSFMIDQTRTDDAGLDQSGYGRAFYRNASVINGVRLFAASGNIDFNLNLYRLDPTGAGGGFVWGQGTGTLADQADLQAALDAKQAAAPFVSQAEAEAGTEASIRTWSPERVKQAIDALAVGYQRINTDISGVWADVFYVQDANPADDWDIAKVDEAGARTNSTRSDPGNGGLSPAAAWAVRDTLTYA